MKTQIGVLLIALFIVACVPRGGERDVMYRVTGVPDFKTKFIQAEQLINNQVSEKSEEPRFILELMIRMPDKNLNVYDATVIPANIDNGNVYTFLIHKETHVIHQIINQSRLVVWERKKNGDVLRLKHRQEAVFR